MPKRENTARYASPLSLKGFYFLTMELSKGRDMREKGWFWLDDEYLNGYARYLGTTATCVYVCLCRHVGKDQTCFPKLLTIAKELGIAKNTVITAVKKLEEWNIIEIKKEYDTELKRQKVNVYLLTDKQCWKAKPQQGAIFEPSPGSNLRQKQGANNEQSRVQPLSHKETHIKETQYKDSEAGASHAQIVEIIDLFKDINPAYGKWYGNITQRKAITRLLESHPEEQIKKIIAILPKTNKIAYIPTITTPSQLEDKWASLEASLNKLKSQTLQNNKNQPNYVL